MSLVHNEQAKLTATYVNGLAIAMFAVGGLAPLVAAGSTIRDFSLGLGTGVATLHINVSGGHLAHLLRDKRAPTLDCPSPPSDASTMNYLPILSLIAVPAGGLALGLWAMWISRPKKSANVR